MLLADIIKFEEKMNNLVKFTVDNSVKVVTNSLIQLGDDIETETNGKGRKFVSRFIEAGIAHYNELGNILITKETLDKFLNTMVGCPLVIQHKEITDKNADKERVGVISDVWYNDKDGWFYCSGVIWDKKAIDLIKNQGWNVSCTYEYVSDFTPRDYNGGKIDMEFTDGKFLYLALVDNPRYTGANIVINSKDIVNNDKWITVKPNGEENKGRHLLLEGNETPKEAMKRQWGVELDKNKDTKQEDAKQEKRKKLIDIADSVSMFDSGSIEKREHDRAIKEINDLNISDDEKKEAIEKLEHYHDNILEHLAKSPSAYRVGVAEFDKRVGFEKSKNNYEKATSLKAEREGYIKQIKEDLRKKEKAKENKTLFETTKKALEDKKLEFEYNGKTWFRTSLKSKSFIALDEYTQKKYNRMKVNNSTNRKDNLIMAVMDELKQFIVNIVNNECDKDKKADNEKVDKRDIIRQIMAIAGKKEDDEDVRTIAKLAEKLAYDESETGTADNEDEVDKRELIREIMAIVGKYAPKEIVETVAKKAEKLGYEKSEAGTADNKCKNEDDEENEEEYKKAKDIADNKKVNNSLSDETVKHIADMIMGGKKTDENVSLYTSQEERLKLGDNY